MKLNDAETELVPTIEALLCEGKRPKERWLEDSWPQNLTVKRWRQHTLWLLSKVGTQNSGVEDKENNWWRTSSENFRVITLTSVENGISKSSKWLRKFWFKSSVVASRSYATQRQNPAKRTNFPLQTGKETWKSEFQETRTSGTDRYQIQNIHKTIKFLSLKPKVWNLMFNVA